MSPRSHHPDFSDRTPPPPSGYRPSAKPTTPLKASLLRVVEQRFAVGQLCMSRPMMRLEVSSSRSVHPPASRPLLIFAQKRRTTLQFQTSPSAPAPAPLRAAAPAQAARTSNPRASACALFVLLRRVSAPATTNHDPTLSQRQTASCQVETTRFRLCYNSSFREEVDSRKHLESQSWERDQIRYSSGRSSLDVRPADKL